jgi:hypothetical protein
MIRSAVNSIRSNATVRGFVPVLGAKESTYEMQPTLNGTYTGFMMGFMVGFMGKS